MPFFGLAEPRKYLVAGGETPEPGHEPVAVVNGISPRYFETVGTRLLSGRSFNDGDTLASPRGFIINQAIAPRSPPRAAPPGPPPPPRRRARTPRPPTASAVRPAATAPSALADSIRTAM